MQTGLDLYGPAPMFPTFYAGVSAEKIEMEVERLVDRCDKIFLRGDMSQDQYDRWNRALEKWADSQYSLII